MAKPSDHPWMTWIPGVLSKKQILALCAEDYILGVSNPTQAIDHSSIDLTLSDDGYRMISGSVKPGGDSYMKTCLNNPGLNERLKPEADGTFLLTKGNTYVFRLNEELNNLRAHPIHGQATAKSSVGRVDVLARLIVDRMTYYEKFEPETLPEGKVQMFLEISPITFDVRVKKGLALSQLRLFLCKPEDSRIRSNEICKYVLHRDRGKVDDTLSVDLSRATVGSKEACAFGAKTGGHPIALWNENNTPISPCTHWDLINTHQATDRLQIEKDRFYILRSKERLSLPPGVAVYCRAIDETIGEMRVHYAGFAHPFFGYKRTDGKRGTPLIFEVREHSFPVCLQDDEKLAKLEFYRMSEDCQKDDKDEVSYGDQELKLSKLFADWPC